MQLALFLGVVGALGAVVLLHWHTPRRIAKFLSGREALTDSQFASLFGSSQEGEVGLSIRELMAPWVSFDPRLIRPDDEFCGHLLFDAYDGMDPEELLRSVEGRWSVSIPDEVAAKLLTIRSLVEEIVRRRGEVQSSKLVDTDAELASPSLTLRQ